MTARAKPYFLKEPWNAQKIEQLDEMLRILYDDLRNGNLTIDLDQLVTGLDEGDILYINGSGSLDGLAIGAAGTVLISDGSLPGWGLVDLTTSVTGILPIANGGTGANTALGAFNNLSPLTTLGDLLTHNGTNNIRLGIGTVGQVLTVVGGAPAWAAAAAGGGDVVGPGSATDNAIARFDGITGKLIQNSGITIADGEVGTLSGSNSGDVTLVGEGDYLQLSGQVLTKSLIDLETDVEGELPPGAGGFFDHNLLSTSHPDTVPGSPEFGDLIVAGSPQSLDIIKPLATHVVEDFYGIRPAYIAGIPGAADQVPPSSGPYPQLLASRLLFRDFINVPAPFPQHSALTSFLEDTFDGIRPSYIHATLGGGSIPGSGPFPTIGNYPITQAAPDLDIVLVSSGQWTRFPKGIEGQVLGIFEGFPRYLTDIDLPGQIDAAGRIRTAGVIDALTAEIHGNAQVGSLSSSGTATANGIVSNLTLQVGQDAQILGDLETQGLTDSDLGYREYNRADKLGDWIQVAFNAANFAAYDAGLVLAGPWTVASGDVITNQYTLIGSTMIWSVRLNTTSLTGATNFYLVLTVPAGLSTTSVAPSRCVFFLDNGVAADAAISRFDATHLSINRLDGGLLTASADLTYAHFLAVLEIA